MEQPHSLAWRIEPVVHRPADPLLAVDIQISAATAKTHVSRLLMKLDAHDRAQLVMIAYETGLLTPAEPFHNRR